jgi:hypothetical protein
VNKAVLITVEHPADCLTCEERIEFGEPAYWIAGVGVWHEDCAEPQNLKTYIADRDAKQKWGTP